MEAVATPEVHCNGGGLLSTSAGSELQIPAMQWLMWRGEWLGRVSGEREECWCGGLETGGAPFIAARQCRRAELGRRRRRRSNVAKGQGMGATGCWCPGEADARVGGEDEGLQRQ
jgi:hypothetical protein